MSSSKAPELLLTGADCFLRAFDDEVRRVNRASHASQLVLQLGPGFDAPRFENLIHEVTAAHPVLHAPIRRRGGFGPPAYQLDQARAEFAPPVEIHPTASRSEIPELFYQRMNQPFRGNRGELLRFDVVPQAEGGTQLAMTWLHMLFDGSGSEAFVEWLESVARGEHSCHELPPDEKASVAPGMPEGLPSKERGRRAMSWQRWMGGMAEPTPHSLAGPLAKTQQALRYDVTTFAGEETDTIVATAKDKAGFLTPMLFYLACAIRAHDAVFRARGLDPGAYIVPLPVNIRPKGSQRAIFRTRVSLLWFRVLPEVARDFEALIEDLKAQRVAAIKAGHVENGVIAMDYARFAPMRVYAHMARRSLGGELCSFFFAFTGEFAAGIDTFLDAPIENAFHAPPVPASPGSSAAMSIRKGRLNVTHVHQEGVFREGEREIFQASLRADLLGRS